jgi:hypothetical protein
MSCGSLARFSAQSVSITPACALSVEREATLDSQKARRRGHSCFGRSSATSQRCWPCALDRTLPP